MLKFLITSIALAAFATTFIAVEAQAEFRACIKGPKDYLPCPMASQRQPQLAKIRTR
jgi:hypothetical protein